MPDLLVFNIIIPCTENSTGIVHSPEKFDTWVVNTAEKFGGVSEIGKGLLGLWYDETLIPEENPLRDYNNWYKIGVKPERITELKEYVKETSALFGQKCLYFERAGEADFIWA